MGTTTFTFMGFPALVAGIKRTSAGKAFAQAASSRAKLLDATRWLSEMLPSGSIVTAILQIPSSGIARDSLG